MKQPKLPKILRFPLEPKGMKCFFKVLGFRAPLEGDFYVSGAIPAAYSATADLSSAYWIVEPTHEALRTPRTQGAFIKGSPITIRRLGR